MAISIAEWIKVGRVPFLQRKIPKESWSDDLGMGWLLRWSERHGPILRREGLDRYYGLPGLPKMELAFDGAARMAPSQSYQVDPGASGGGGWELSIPNSVLKSGSGFRFCPCESRAGSCCASGTIGSWQSSKPLIFTFCITTSQKFELPRDFKRKADIAAEWTRTFQ